MHATEHHTGGVLNICLCYTSRHEMAHAVGVAQRAVREGIIAREDLDSRSLDQCMSSAPSPPVDLLIRTSGEARLSDFMLRQCGTAKLVFLRVLWPDLTFHHFARAVLDYQHTYFEQRKLRRIVQRAQARQSATDRERAESWVGAGSPRRLPSLTPTLAEREVVGDVAWGSRRQRRSSDGRVVDSASEYPSNGVASGGPDSPVDLTVPPGLEADLLLSPREGKGGIIKRGRTRSTPRGPLGVLAPSSLSPTVPTGTVFRTPGTMALPGGAIGWSSALNLETPGIGGLSPWFMELSRVWVDRVL